MLEADFADFDVSDPAVAAAVDFVFASIDYDAAMRSGYVIPEYKKALRRHRSPWHRLRRRLGLIGMTVSS